ncbi:MAG TPA: sulfotransferase family 2 domain-containing protein [Candidatus Dormibacteraeota bacterium]|nr:sulfotransferase family 2 domain-containing protein [Candidatus Dormibacteraeota bacterium]
MISHQHKCIFVHIPKCGGTSIEDLIWPGERTEADLWMGFTDSLGNRYQTGALQHLLARHIRAEVGKAAFFAYFKFTIVRNPWDKALSQYAFMRRRDDLRAYIGMERDDEFKRYLELIGKRTHVQWMPQHAFIHDDDGAQMVDYIGRFERLAHDVELILQRVGVQGSLPHRKAATHRLAIADLDDEAIDMVAALYAEDIRIFGYERPE